MPRHRDALIVDAACGGGRLLHLFQTLGYTAAVGTDLSPDQVALARQVTPNVFLQDIDSFLSERQGQVELLTGFDVIEHLDKDEVLQFLDGAFTALQSGGRLVLQTPNGSSPMGMSVRYGDVTHEVCFSPECLGGLLRLTGFTEIEAREVGPILAGHSFKSTIRWCAWQLIRCFIGIWNAAETGSRGSPVLTRVFLISGIKA
jgi:SAM-dependent methyltransferase